LGTDFDWQSGSGVVASTELSAQQLLHQSSRFKLFLLFLSKNLFRSNQTSHCFVDLETRDQTSLVLRSVFEASGLNMQLCFVAEIVSKRQTEDSGKSQARE
jgi:hypothetical protein